jgi:hypothetical protein
MESGGGLTAGRSRELLARSLSGEVSDLYRFLCLVNLEVWVRARDLRRARPQEPVAKRTGRDTGDPTAGTGPCPAPDHLRTFQRHP